MAQLSESRMNIAAVKGVDPYVKDIVDMAAHVALYSFNAEDNEWEKTEVEGALFVYSRSGEPFHNIIILNRLNTNNYVEPVAQGLDLHVQDPFLLYRTARCGIFCIWFYDKTECTRIATALNKLVKELIQNSEKKNVKQSKESNNVANNPGSVDIFSMLTKAQEEYNSKVNKTDNNDGKNTKEVTNSTSRSVMEFFAKASSGTQFSKDGPKNLLPTNLLMGPRPLPPPGLHQVQIGLPHPQNDVKIMQRLMSTAHTVEHIEKQQQRALTPQSELAALMKSKAPNLVNKDKVVQNKKVTTSERKPNNPVSSTNLRSQIENGMGFLRINEAKSPIKSGPTVIQSHSFFNSNLTKSPSTTEVEQRSLSAPHGSALDATLPKPALMPPVMFTVSASKDEPNPMRVISHTPNNKPRPEPLTQNQLLQAFNYLLKNDPDFMRILHEAYVKSFSERVT